MCADSAPSRERTAEFVLHRPLGLTAGAARRLRVYIDDERAADLHLGATTRVPAEAGPHLLRVRCFPLISADLPVILAPHETLRVAIYVGVLDDLQIDIAPTNEQARQKGTTGP
jgi:hypothetical protein